MADAIRDRMLRDRADGGFGEPTRPISFRFGGDAIHPAAMRLDDRRWAGGDEDVAGAAADLVADARAQVVHFDGGLCLFGRGL
jgi:hypothetical protein